MPAKEIMPLFKAGKLHSGSGGPIVTNPSQAIAIKRSYEQKEGVKKGGHGRAFS